MLSRKFETKATTGLEGSSFVGDGSCHLGTVLMAVIGDLMVDDELACVANGTFNRSGLAIFFLRRCDCAALRSLLGSGRVGGGGGIAK